MIPKIRYTNNNPHIIRVNGSNQLLVRNDESSWTPSQLGVALGMWFDASDTGTITLNGSNVSGWNDKSGNNRHVSQAIASAQPTYQTNNLNGLAGISSAGSPIRLESASNISWNFDIGSFASVCSFGGANSWEALFILDGRQTAAQFFFFRRRETAALADLWRQTPLNSSAAVYTGRYNRSVAVNGSTNGTYYSSALLSTFTTSSTISRLTILGPSNVLVGTINELIVLNSYISDTNREKLEGYLAHKWGLTNNLPSNHPYKNNTPTI